MKWIVVGLMLVLGGWLGMVRAEDEPTAELWKRVSQAQKEGLPKTAIAQLEKIYSLAVAGRRWSEALKALVWRTTAQAVAADEPGEERIRRLIAEEPRVPAALRPLVRGILAHWYWDYFQENSWRFARRSATTAGEGGDFTTWDVRRLVAHVDELYRGLLGEQAVLAQIPLSEFAGFLDPGDQPAALRPTLFDFLAREAIDFYVSAESDAVRPEEPFDIAADSPALAPAAEFIRERLTSPDANAPRYRALLTFQQLLRQHRDEPDPGAFLDHDLARLSFARRAAVGEGASDRYLSRLQEITTHCPAHPLASTAWQYGAQELHDTGRLVEALALAERGASAHPESAGGKNCWALASEIRARSLSLRSERNVLPGSPSAVTVSYRNLTALTLRLVRDPVGDDPTTPDGGRRFFSFHATEESKRLLTQPVVRQWTVELPPTPDYRTREQRIELPALDAGHYALLVSCRADFLPASNALDFALLQVSELTMVSRSRQGGLEGLLLRAAGGEPVAGAEVTSYQPHYPERTLTRLATTRTDAAGCFALPRGADSHEWLLIARAPGGGRLTETNRGHANDPRPAEPAESIVFFTDRALYRPGQMLHFKGIVLAVDQPRGSYRAVSDRPVTVAMLDANGQEVGRLDLRSNAFGSVQGTFPLPLGRLPGNWRLTCPDLRGTGPVQVEEYKRPKFEVKLTQAPREFRLGEELSVPGRAESYAGAPLDGVGVRYRVVRVARFPRWWWGPAVGSGEQEIARGQVKTDASGNFTIPFVLRPDPAIDRRGDPVFSYRLTVEVTDATGESRGDEITVSAGYVGLEATLTVPPCPLEGMEVPLTVGLRSHGGLAMAGQGTVTVYALRGPERPVASELATPWRRGGREEGKTGDPSDWRNWPSGDKVVERPFVTGGEGTPATVVPLSLSRGAYRAVLDSRDAAGQPVRAMLSFLVLRDGAGEPGLPVPFVFALAKGSWEVGETFHALAATGYDRGPMRVEFFRDNRLLKAYWTEPGRPQTAIDFPVTEELRGGFTLVVTLVKENRLYQEVRPIAVPWSGKELKLAWATFRDRQRPGQAETWQLKISGPRTGPLAAELVATLYDASLDQYLAHRFPGFSGLFARDRTWLSHAFANQPAGWQSCFDNLNVEVDTVTPQYPSYPGEVLEYGGWLPWARRKFARRLGMALPMAAPMAESDAGVAGGGVESAQAAEPEGIATDGEMLASGPPAVAVQDVRTRTNLTETAFFFPQRVADADGTVTLSFRMPEALTRWHFMAFAHTADLRSGGLEAFTVTQKELMVQPNPPRFLREGDELEFPVKVSNLTDRPLSGTARLTFTDPDGDRGLDTALGLAQADVPFDLPARGSTTLSWRLHVPGDLSLVSFKTVATAGEFSDGEEGLLPVLPRRIAVREAVALWVNGPGEKRFTLDKLKDPASAATRKDLSLTVEMTGNPAWTAIMALPTLMEYPHECAEQLCNRLYANALARTVAVSHPRIRAVFEQWRQAGGPVSPLEKNEELKSVMLLESPWVLEGKSQTENRRRIGLLFDENRMDDELDRAQERLRAMRTADGAWPWFPGGPANEYITLYNVTSLGRLRHLGVRDVADDLALSALPTLDRWLAKRYRDIRPRDLPSNHLDAMVALCLYARSFYLGERPIPAGEVCRAWDYFAGQGARHWLSLGVMGQAQLALALNRIGDRVTAGKILKSLRERSQYEEELGRHWPESSPWHWAHAPIETQAVVIEAFAEVAADEETASECRRWLLKQKQTQDWGTTKATADAVYALLCRGGDPLATGDPVEVYLGGHKVEPGRTEAGTESFQRWFRGAEVKPEMGDIRVVKGGAGIAWGGVHWRYLQDAGVIGPAAGGPLRVEKKLFVRRDTARGPLLDPVTGPLAVGDRVVVRLELSCDRDLEYVHLTDARGSVQEPVEVLSGYRRQDGLGYYQSIRDTGVHFFFESLPKGRYVFEYPLATVHRGRTQTGPAQVQCMYAPEFMARSASLPLEVK